MDIAADLGVVPGPFGSGIAGLRQRRHSLGCSGDVVAADGVVVGLGLDSHRNSRRDLEDWRYHMSHIVHLVGRVESRLVGVGRTSLVGEVVRTLVEDNLLAAAGVEGVGCNLVVNSHPEGTGSGSFGRSLNYRMDLTL